MTFGSIMIFGDSYSTYTGWVPEGYSVYYTGDRQPPHPNVREVGYTWWGRLIEATGAHLIQNNSWSGSTICYTGYHNTDCSRSSSFIYRFEALLADGFFDRNRIDTLFVFGATNDSWANAPLGELTYEGITEGDLYSVLPALSHFAKRLKEALPETRVVFMENGGLKPEIAAAMRAVCEHYGHTHVLIGDVDKMAGHPTELGMEQICNILLTALA